MFLAIACIFVFLGAPWGVRPQPPYFRRQPCYSGGHDPRVSRFSRFPAFSGVRCFVHRKARPGTQPATLADRRGGPVGPPPPSASISLVRFGSLGFSGSFRPALRSVMVRSRRAASGAAKRLLGRSPTWIQCAPGPGRRGGLGGPRFGATAREWLALAHGGCREAGCKGGCRGGLVSRVVLQGSCTGGCRVGARIHAGTPAARIHAGTPAASNIPAPRGASGRIWMSFVS